MARGDPSERWFSIIYPVIIGVSLLQACLPVEFDGQVASKGGATRQGEKSTVEAINDTVHIGLFFHSPFAFTERRGGFSTGFAGISGRMHLSRLPTGIKRREQGC